MINDFVVRGTNGLKTTHMCHDAIFCEKRHNLSQYSFFEIYGNNRYRTFSATSVKKVKYINILRKNQFSIENQSWNIYVSKTISRFLLAKKSLWSQKHPVSRSFRLGVKGGLWVYIRIFGKKRVFCRIGARFQKKLSQRVLNIFCWFLVQVKAGNPYFRNQKFFTPLY